jgi:hypothetical protein
MTRHFQRPPILFLIAATSIVVLAFALLRPSEPATRLISHWQPQPMITQPDLPSERAAPPPPAIAGEAQPVAAAASFDISVADGLYPNERDALSADLQQAFAYVSERFDGVARTRFTAAVLQDGACGLHGLAYTDVRVIQVYTCPGVGHDRAVAILAHEMVHQLQYDRYGPQHLSADLILAEGMATWGAGTYWLGNHPDFRAFVREQRANSQFYPLATHYSGLGVAAMNTLYYQWAGFVEYLLTTYGREKFDQLYITGRNAPGSADYQSVYGKDLDTLEREWIAWLGE